MSAQVKCLNPVVIINPEAIKRIGDFDYLYLKGVYSYPAEFVVASKAKFSPKRFSVKPSDVDKCFLLSVKTGEVLPFYLVVPCGHCIICRKRKAQALSARAIAETNTCGKAPLFITLTYNNDMLPINDVDGTPTLQKRHFQLFMKRLRSLLDEQNIEHSLRYLACGEYGSKTKRPHYHLLLWNFPSEKIGNPIEVEHFIQKAWSVFMLKEDDKGKMSRIPVRKSCVACPYRSLDQVDKCKLHSLFCKGEYVKNPNGSQLYRRYPYGMVKVLQGNAGAPAYITKYMVKGSFQPSVESEPTFNFASNGHGGIGSQYIREHADEIRKTPEITALPILDKVTGSNRIFYLPINQWVKGYIYPSASRYLKSKEYQIVREFVNTYELFEQTAQQLYTLYPMDKFVDREHIFYRDSFTDPSTRENWKKAYDHVKEYQRPYNQYDNFGSYLQTRDEYQEEMYVLTERLDNLTRKVLEINIDPSYFSARNKFNNKRNEALERIFAGTKDANLEAIANAIAEESKRNVWREYF